MHSDHSTPSSSGLRDAQCSGFAPRIYYVQPSLVGPLSENDNWNRLLDRIADMGFDHLLIAPPFLPGRGGDIFVTADHHRLAPALCVGDSADDSNQKARNANSGADGSAAIAWLAQLSAMAEARGLRLLLDVVIDRIAVDAGLYRDHPDWYQAPNAQQGHIDPRHAPTDDFVALAHFDRPEVAAPMIDWWRGQLLQYAQAGVRGFRFEGINGIAPHVWRRLAAGVRERFPEQRLLAWTPGATRDALRNLENTGFDAVFSSVRWWDARADWLADEQQNLARIAAPVAFPETPFGPRLATDLPTLASRSDRDALQRAYTRALQLSALTGAGWLMPMGFEYGVDVALSRTPDTRSAALFHEAISHPAFDLQSTIRTVNGMYGSAGKRVDTSPAGSRPVGSRPANSASGTFATVPKIADALRQVLSTHGALRALTGPDAAASALLRTDSADPRFSHHAGLVLVNPDLYHPAVADLRRWRDGLPGGFTLFAPLSLAGSSVAGTAGGTGDSANDDRPLLDAADIDIDTITLAPAEVRLMLAGRAAPIVLHAGASSGANALAGKKTGSAADRKATVTAIESPRIAIEGVTPSVDEGRFAAKRVVGEAVTIEADIFIDGHDHLAAAVLWRTADHAADDAHAGWHEIPMQASGNDRWQAELPLLRLGAYQFTIAAWRDTFDTLVDHIRKKRAAAQAVSLELQEAAILFERILLESRGADGSAHLDSARIQALEALQSITNRYQQAASDEGACLEIVLADATAAIIRATGHRDFHTRYPVIFTIQAERREARFASWYELFPRSQSGDPQRHGTFIDVIARLPAIRAMGFDVLYFPPIHPIGRSNRKGPNNTLIAAEHDVGSPYAIGSADGGHTAIHPELGTLDDFRLLLQAAREHGLELALDFAIQCSPDHPWLREHPGWFAWRPDGSLRYAENPPKKYQDIVNPDFYANDAIPDLWLALRDAVLFWVAEGVDIFRVDNPHTKPFPFWEWMIGEVRRRHPQTIFLSEAFTRPKVMSRLAKVGFSQSYTYFTWRDSREELTEYLDELTQTALREYFRPNFFVNTPDINPRFLQRSGRAGFAIRAALAALLAGVWGVYSGFELCEAAALPNSEEYLDSEKYQNRAWDWERPGNIIEEISLLNRIRRANPALHTHLNLTFLPSSNPNVLFFEKATPNRDNVLLIAISVDPWSPQESAVEIPLWRWGRHDGETLDAHDLVSGERFQMQGKHQTIRLDPQVLPFAIRRVQAPGWQPPPSRLPAHAALHPVLQSAAKSAARLAAKPVTKPASRPASRSGAKSAMQADATAVTPVAEPAQQPGSTPQKRPATAQKSAKTAVPAKSASSKNRSTKGGPDEGAGS